MNLVTSGNAHSLHVCPLTVLGIHVNRDHSDSIHLSMRDLLSPGCCTSGMAKRHTFETTGDTDIEFAIRTMDAGSDRGTRVGKSLIVVLVAGWAWLDG